MSIPARYPMNIGFGDGVTTTYYLPNHADIWNPAAQPVLYITDSWRSYRVLSTATRANLYVRSEDFNTTWSKNATTVDTNQTIAPDGTLTADKLKETSSTASHTVSQPNASTAAPGTLTVSCYMKAADRDLGIIAVRGLSVATAYFDLVNGVCLSITGSAPSKTSTIENIGNGWYRCSCTATAGSGGFMVIGAAITDGSSSYVGSTGKGIYLWGAQYEEGPNVTEYIKTTTATKTLADYALTLSTYTITLGDPLGFGEVLSWDGSTLDRG